MVMNEITRRQIVMSSAALSAGIAGGVASAITGASLNLTLNKTAQANEKNVASDTRSATASSSDLSSSNDSNDVLSFLQSLDYEDGLGTTVAILQRFPMQYGVTLGLDGAPQIRPLEFKFEDDGVLYFDTVDYYESYREMQTYPTLQLCIGDQATMFYLRVGGTVNFTRDEDVIERCFEASPVLTSQFGNDRSHVVGYYLTDAWAEFATFTEGLPNKRWDLTNKFDA